ncbi:hypothetical protein C2W62_48915 [Candidatus Entotheonella serta]|nr:hypothetical protein C2W62_48915 [Candidatus Entotheonella serta]
MTAIQLINTIEISPYDYANQEYESPKPSGWEDPEAWHQYWIQCISDKGLDSLKPIEPGSYFVDIQTIGDALAARANNPGLFDEVVNVGVAEIVAGVEPGPDPIAHTHHDGYDPLLAIEASTASH